MNRNVNLLAIIGLAIGAAFGLLTLTIISWILLLLKEIRTIKSPTYQQATSVAG